MPPVAVSVAVPPEHMEGLLTVGTGALSTVTVMLAEQVVVVQSSIYEPGRVNPETVLVGEVGEVKVTVAGLPAAALQVPVPVAAIVAVVFGQTV